jgi:hypothetical protein
MMSKDFNHYPHNEQPSSVSNSDEGLRKSRKTKLSEKSRVSINNKIQDLML